MDDASKRPSDRQTGGVREIQKRPLGAGTTTKALSDKARGAIDREVYPGNRSWKKTGRTRLEFGALAQGGRTRNKNNP